MDKDQFKPLVALIDPTQELEALYKSHEITTFKCRGIFRWEHSTVSPRPIYSVFTWIHLIKLITSFTKTIKNTIKLVGLTKPDIVHLNSMPLSISAIALLKYKIKFVWHVREPPYPSYGIRYKIIQKIMLKAPKLIFISKADRHAWVKDKKGIVIPNFIDFTIYNKSLVGEKIKNDLGIDRSNSVVLYLGTLSKVKGIFTLVRALCIVKDSVPNVKCLMPGSYYPPPNTIKLKIIRYILPLFGMLTTGQKSIKMIKEQDLESVCILLPFSTDIPPYIAVSDVLVFPAIRPHFARPVIEAASIGKPSVATNLPGIDELVEDGKSGLLFENGNPIDLADKILSILRNKNKCAEMGKRAREIAKEKFTMEKNVGEIEQIYNQILNNHSHARV